MLETELQCICILFETPTKYCSKSEIQNLFHICYNATFGTAHVGDSQTDLKSFYMTKLRSYQSPITGHRSIRDQSVSGH